MKNILYIIITLFCISCTDLDLNPLSEGASANWYSNQEEINMSINGLYRNYVWPKDDEIWSDNWTSRQITGSEIIDGTLTSESKFIETYWVNAYKVIARCNTLLENIHKIQSQTDPTLYNQYLGEVKFVKASVYSRLVSHFGDVPFLENTLTIEEAFKIGRTDKKVIIDQIYKDFDDAIEFLPKSYSSNDLQRATKGTASALKSRYALYFGDFAIAADAAKKCIDLKIYKLHSNYSDLFYSKTKNSKEVIFSIPRNVELDDMLKKDYPVMAVLPRNRGGWGVYNPSWELFASYECVDGLRIDKSPLFDPQNPFKNRDPRLKMSIVEFESDYLGFFYDPSPLAKEVMDYTLGKKRKNNDSRINTQYASHNALLWRKGVDEDWLDFQTDPDNIIIRYAEVLLNYAEAKVEINQIDETVLEAINLIRQRAYNDTELNYPEVTSTDQNVLRTLIRNERRVELAYEGLRYMDLIRWKMAEKVLVKPIYGILDPSEQIEKLINKNLYFWPYSPDFDENDMPDFSKMHKEGYCKLLVKRNWDESRQYLWPIPMKEVLINENLKQNKGY